MFTREQALELLHKNMQNKNLRKHCYAVEAVMRSLAQYFCEEGKLPEEERKGSACAEDIRLSSVEDLAEAWGIAGLIHDADYELTKNDPSKHVHTVVSWLKERNVDEKIVNAVFAHGWRFIEGCPESSNTMEWSLYCCDELTGFIVAVALVRPDKKLSSVAVDSVLKKWNVKAFAAGVNRQQIEMCEEKLGINLADFIKISLSAMQGISDKLGL